MQEFFNFLALSFFIWLVYLVIKRISSSSKSQNFKSLNIVKHGHRCYAEGLEMNGVSHHFSEFITGSQ